MRVRNLMSKPNAVDYIMVKPRWGSKLSAEDGHITLNTGTNNTGVERTEFDILANQDTNIKASPSNANIQLVTDLPDCQLCLAFTAKALTGMTVRLLTAWWNGTLWNQIGTTAVDIDSGQTTFLSASLPHVQGRRDSFSIRPKLDDVMPANTDVMQVSDLTIVTEDERTIMNLLEVGAFSAETAPYAAVPDGGGVFLLALIVLIGGWRHENTESMAGPALRKQGRHLECDTGIRHHSEERRLLGIHPSQGHSLHPASAGRMHDDAAQPAQLMGLHTSGAGGYAAHGEWGSRHEHHQRRNKEYYWHPCACRRQDHSDGHVRRRSGRMADPAGGRSARLRSRHRTILNVPGVAA